MLRQAARINSLSEIALTKLAVLSDLEEVKICVAYEVDGERLTRLPYHQSVLHRVKPIYETLPGWTDDLSAATSVADLPDSAQAYLRCIEEHVGVPITYVGVGPGREQFVQFHR